MDKLLQQKIETTFIKNECDRTAPHIQASVIEAASQMALYSGMMDYDQAKAEIKEIFGAEPGSEVDNLIEAGVPQTTVKANIGFSTEYKDGAMADYAYGTQKAEYDALYNAIVEHATKKQEKAKTM